MSYKPPEDPNPFTEDQVKAFLDDLVNTCKKHKLAFWADYDGFFYVSRMKDEDEKFIRRAEYDPTIF